MNLSTAIMLVNKGVRAVKVQYDPDVPKNNNYGYTYKTLDPDIKVDDLVIVATSTRQGFTVAKVIEADIRIDFSDTSIQYKWIAGKVDLKAYEDIIAQEKVVLDRIASAEENRIRAELAKSMGLSEVNLTDLDIVKGTVATPALSSPRGAGNSAEPLPDVPVQTA